MTTASKPAAPSLSGDIGGGFASMLVALPSSIAYGVLIFSAVGPEYAGEGALAGVLGAAAMGLVAPLVGRNGGLISAPCAPAAAVLSGVAAQFVANSVAPARVAGLLALTLLLAAAFQLLLGAVRAGRLIKYIPYQVVSGYLSGVAVIIALGQLPKFLGLPKGTGLGLGLTSPALWEWPAIVSGVAAMAAMAAALRFTRKIPAAILGLGAGTTAFFICGLFRKSMLVLEGNHFLIGRIGGSDSLFTAISKRAVHILDVAPADVALVVVPALTLAVLLSIDTLKTCVVLDALTRSRHNSNRELLAQGAGNIASCLAGGMPGAGTMGPTLVNVISGGRTPRSGFLEGVFAVATFVALGGLIGWIPIAALAGILLVISWRMFDRGMFRLLRQPSTKLDFLVIAAVIIVAPTIGLIEASAVGIGLAILLFIRDQIRGSVVLRKTDLSRVASKTKRIPAEREILDAQGGLGVMVELQGNLFFGTTDQLFSELDADLQTRRYILLDLRRVQSMDYTAGHLFEQVEARLGERDGALLLSGMPSSLPTRQDIANYLAQLGLVREGVRVFETRDGALEWMENRILESAGISRMEDTRMLGMNEIELFRESDESMLAELSEVMQMRSVAAGKRVFSLGDEGDELFLIRRGSVQIFLPLRAGKRHHLATFGPGDFFGELVFLDRGKRSADAEAKTDVDLYVVSRDRFNALALRDPVLATRVFARLARAVTYRLRSADAELHALEER